ncbi:lysophospholipid acyltransferase family protein [Streptomyces sp. NPDC047928]|uniref:lysophospholipid acyltransferase family protein n=1 Tax=unclassified Streptomyces TaxID=2593676 RepID=UPI00371C18B0
MTPRPLSAPGRDRSPWLPTSPCTPRGCATTSDGACPVPPVWAAVRLTAGILVVLTGVLLAPLTALFAAAARHALTRLWCGAVLSAFGVRIRVVGTPRGGPQLVVANHISWLDVPLIAAVLPGRMVAKSEIRHWPLLGPLAARGGTLFVARDRLRSLPGTVRALADALTSGARVVVFPEGSTWCGRASGRFRPAAFQAALDAGAPVQPVRIAYLPVGPAAFVGDDPLPASLWRVAAAGGLTAEIRILDPIPAAPGTDRRSLAWAAQTAVASDTANRPRSSVHHRASSSPAAASSARTPS